MEKWFFNRFSTLCIFHKNLTIFQGGRGGLHILTWNRAPVDIRYIYNNINITDLMKKLGYYGNEIKYLMLYINVTSHGN